MSLAEVREVVVEYLHTRSGMSTVCSPLGRQLDAMRDETPRPDRWTTQARAESKQFRFALLASLWGLLSIDEQAVIAALNTPSGTEQYERTVPRGDVLHENAAGQAIQFRTRLDETVIRDAGEPGFLVVQGSRAIYPSRTEVAGMLGLSLRQVRTRVGSAYQKIEDSGLLRALRR